MYIHGSRLFNVGRSGYVGEQSPLLQAPRRHGRHGYRSGWPVWQRRTHSGWQPESGALTRHPKLAAEGASKAIDILAQTQLQERVSREGWQNNHAPTISQYVDVRAGAGAGAGAGANALAAAEAMALASAINNNSNGLNSAIGGCNFLRVARYSAPKPCGCDTCQD